MSFDDLMSSGRGPGVIGLLMALLVLGGFGALYVFVFDAEMQGKGVTLEAVIRDQKKEIDAYKTDLVHHEAKLAEAPRLSSKAVRLESLKKENNERAAILISLREGIAQLTTRLPEIDKSYRGYQDEYRALIRSKAVGEQVDEIVSRSGAVYKKVEIREVTPVGVQIRHEDGQKRIAFEELSDEWQQRFQFDPNQKEKALALEAVRQQEHEKAVLAANESFGAEQAAAAERQGELKIEQTRRLILAKEQLIKDLSAEIKRVQTESRGGNGNTSTLGSTGRGGLRGPTDYKEMIREKQNAINVLKSEIQTLRLQL